MKPQKSWKNCCDTELLYIAVISAINILYCILNVTRMFSADVYREVNYAFLFWFYFRHKKIQ